MRLPFKYARNFKIQPGKFMLSDFIRGSWSDNQFPGSVHTIYAAQQTFPVLHGPSQ